MFFGHRIGPLNLRGLVHNHHAVGQVAHGVLKALQPFGQLRLMLFVGAAQRIEFGKNIAPHPMT